MEPNSTNHKQGDSYNAETEKQKVVPDIYPQKLWRLHAIVINKDCYWNVPEQNPREEHALKRKED